MLQFSTTSDDGIICRVPYSLSRTRSMPAYVCAVKQLKHAIKILLAVAFLAWFANAAKRSLDSTRCRRVHRLFIHWLIICASLHFYLIARTISFFVEYTRKMLIMFDRCWRRHSRLPTMTRIFPICTHMVFSIISI